MQKDAKIISASDNISLFNNRIVLDGGVNIISDNLSGNKDVTNTNTNWYAQALVRPKNLPYFRVGYNSNQAVDDLEDKEINQKMDSINYGVGYTFNMLPYTTPSLDISLTNSNDTDLSELSIFDFKRDNIQFNLFNTLKEIPLNTRLSIGISNNKDLKTTPEENRKYTQWGLKNEYSLLNGILTPYLDLRFNYLTGDQDKQNISTYDIGTKYKPFSKTTINTNFEISHQSNTTTEDSNYSTVNWRLNITQVF